MNGKIPGPDVSAKFTPWAFRQSLRGIRLTGTQYRLAIELAEHTKSGKPAAWPSIATLARHCCLNPRTVERGLKELVDLGIIRKGHGKSTRILVVQVPVHRPVNSGPQTGHTPVHRPDEYLKYENKGPKTNGNGFSAGQDGSTSGANRGLASSRVSANEVVGFNEDCDPLDRMKHVPPNRPDRRNGTCPGCDGNDPWAGHAPSCPNDPEMLNEVSPAMNEVLQ